MMVLSFDDELSDAFASCFEYPGPHTAGSARRVAKALRGHGSSYDASAAALLTLADHLDADLHRAEERYTRMFDLKPTCTLNLGWHIFGENYDRGAMLVGLVGELDARGVEHRHDLPDFLPTLLRLLFRMEEREDRTILGYSVIEPALTKINKLLEISDDPWPLLLRQLPGIIASEVPKDKSDVPRPRRALEVLPC